LKAGWTPLIHAAYAGDADCIALLIGAGAKLEAKTKVNSRLWFVFRFSWLMKGLFLIIVAELTLLLLSVFCIFVVGSTFKRGL